MVRKTPRKFSVIAIGNIIWYNYRIMAEGSDDRYGVKTTKRNFMFMVPCILIILYR